MSPLFMDTALEEPSPGSLSAEETNSNNAGSEREEGKPMGHRGSKRQEKNRDAARKSRKKQTERADELHEELQNLERSNSALRKEIASLEKDLRVYTTALELHEPVCSLIPSGSSSASFLSVSPSVDSHPGPSPLQESSCTQATAPSPSTSVTSRIGLHTLDFVESTYLSSSTVKSLDPPANLSPQLFTSSSSFPLSTVPHSSLFSKDAPSLITREKKAVPVRTSIIPSPVLSIPVTTAAQTQPGQGTINEGSAVSANPCSTTCHHSAQDAFIMKPASLLFPSSHAAPSYPPVARVNTGQAVQGCHINMAHPHPGIFRGKPVTSSLVFSLKPSTVQDSAVHLLPVTPQTNQELSSSSGYANSTSLLSLLTTPSQHIASQTTSSSAEGLLPHTSAPLQTIDDSAMDVSLFELLEENAWILQGDN